MIIARQARPALRLAAAIASTAMVFATFPQPVSAATALLHSMNYDDDGSGSTTPLTISGSTLYGTAYEGGANDNGTVFSIGTDGSGFTVLRHFEDTGSDGAYPYSGVVIDGSTLYGTTEAGGTQGVVYSMGTDGSGFTVLHDFQEGASDGGHPTGELLLSGTTLYGVAGTGGDDDLGVIYSIQTNGTGFTLLHEFAGGGSDGAKPFAGLTLSGGKLYGTTRDGGDSNVGTVYSIDTDGSNFTLIHEFAGGTADGDTPYSGVILSGSTLYGTTYSGGDDDSGTIFSVGTDGSNFTLLHEFAGGAADGANPYYSTLTINDNTLYGTTAYGGEDDVGTVFSINTDGSDYTILHVFAGPFSDGDGPEGGLLFSNNILYGTTYYGGANEEGTVYSIILDSTAPSISLTAGTDPTTDTTPALTGTATDAAGTTASVEFQMDGTSGSWTACTADDGTFDEAAEAFTCTVTSALSTNASHTIYVRATDSNSNVTSSDSYASDEFTVSGSAATEIIALDLATSGKARKKDTDKEGNTTLGKKTTTNFPDLKVKWTKPSNTNLIEKYILFYREIGEGDWDSKEIAHDKDEAHFEPGEGRYEWFLRTVFNDGSTSETSIHRVNVDTEVAATNITVNNETVEEGEGTTEQSLIFPLGSPLTITATGNDDTDTVIEIWNADRTVHYDTMVCGPGPCDRGHILNGSYTLVIYTEDEAGNTSDERIVHVSPFTTTRTTQPTGGVQGATAQQPAATTPEAPTEPAASAGASASQGKPAPKTQSTPTKTNGFDTVPEPAPAKSLWQRFKDLF